MLENGNLTQKAKPIRLCRWPELAALLLVFLFAGRVAAQSSSNPGADLLSFANKTVAWHRQVTGLQQLVREPAELTFFDDNRQTAGQIVRLSFDFARARAKDISSQPTATPLPDMASASTQYQKLAAAAAKADQQVVAIQQEIDGLQRQLERASGKKRTTLQATIAETEGERELFQARRDAIHSMMQVGGNRQGEGANLSAQIEELARTVPPANVEGQPAGAGANPSSSANPIALTQATVQHQAPAGIFGLISDLTAQHRKMDALDENLRDTDSLAASARALRTPLGEKMRELAQKGDELAAQPDATDPAVLAQQREDLDALTAQYKQISASLLPLGRQSILFDIYKRGVTNWRTAVKSQYQGELKSLVLRLVALGALVGLVFAISEFWRRATFRYISDTHRRHQFLMVRRIVVWFLVAVVVAIAFASELGALATFAGFLTAGIAVALQNVILSVAGYFFLIGKHGVRIGDRVQVAGIIGDVVDIGLVRLHLMEVSGGNGARPTGRIVAVSNAVVFQANAGMFKQIPGTNFVWREVTLTPGPQSDYLQVEKRMLEAVNKVFSEYHESMELQRRRMERNFYAIHTRPFSPESRLRLAPTGVEVVIRYPVELGNAAEIDDRVTRELLEAIGRDPTLRLVGVQVEPQSA